MISKSDIKERLSSLIGKELNSKNLHEALFCEGKHEKILRRFQLGKYIYVEYKVKEQEQSEHKYVADISLTGNPNKFRIDLMEQDEKYIIKSEPRITY